MGISERYLKLAKPRLARCGNAAEAIMQDVNIEAIEACTQLKSLVKAAIKGLEESQKELIGVKVAPTSFGEYIIRSDGKPDKVVKYFAKPMKEQLDDNKLALTVLYMLKHIHSAWRNDFIRFFRGNKKYEFMPMMLVGTNKLREYYDIVEEILKPLDIYPDFEYVEQIYNELQDGYLAERGIKKRDGLIDFIKFCDFSVVKHVANYKLLDDNVPWNVELLIVAPNGPKEVDLEEEIADQLLRANPQMRIKR